MRPLPPTRRRPVPRVLAALRLLPWLLLLPPLAPTAARADDTVRRAQEELRKRNLYFGDIDGVPNRGTVGALKRYQERKRLAITGEIDGETLHSLGVPAPPSNVAAAPLDPDPWPEVPVLRSDLGRRPPPLAGEVVIPEALSPVPATATAAGGGRAVAGTGGPPPPPGERGTPPTAEANAATVPPPDPPAGAAAAPTEGDAPLMTPEAARVFLEGYLRDGSANDLGAEMAHYAEEVDYFTKGPTGRDYIRRDVSNYYKRWTERRYEIIGPVTVYPGARPGETTARFLLQFRCRGKDHQAQGRTTNFFTLQRTPTGEVRITGMKEQRVR